MIVNRWDQFFGFVSGPDSRPAGPALKRELEAAGVDVARVDAAIAGIVAGSRSLVREGWLERARRAQADFERSVKKRRARVSEHFTDAGALLTAIGSGQLGVGVQRQAMVFFRNGKDLSEASESDLRSFIDDCQELGLIDRQERSRR
jgi:hypothetical protein